MERIKNFINGLEVSFSGFPGISITDIIDILLVAYIMYIFLNWIHETRAWSLIKGIFIVVVLLRIFLVLELYSMAFIIDKVFETGLIAAIVLFQPELRKILEQLGRGRFIASTDDGVMGINKEIIDAVRFLASQKTGALICIEQAIGLGDYEKTGIYIDGVISKQILINIFVDKTPLHDGAVIIRKSRIAAAGCILPVTSQEIGKELGTRHRAAVGLSEVSDSIVLIVSEETGMVSVAKGGKLYKKLTYEEILNMLHHNREEEKDTFFSSLRRRIMNDKN